MILATYQLIDINREIESMPEDAFPTIQTSNTYAELVFKVTGNIGYWIYYICSLITLYGSNIGSMVVMTDFLSVIPMGPPHLRRLYAQIILTILCIILCLLKDPKMLVGVSSLGLFAIAGGFITLIMYVCNDVVDCLASEVLATECISLTMISGPSPSRPSFRTSVLLCTAWDSFCSF